MKRLVVTAAALSLLAAGPAVAAKKAPVHAPCKAPAGAFVVKAGGPALEMAVETPVGALNSAAVDAEVEVGSFYVDLGGKPQTSRGSLSFTLAWDNPVSDYDLVVNGSNDLSTDNPEFRSESSSHCRRISVSVDVFYGVPVDALTLTAKAS